MEKQRTSGYFERLKSRKQAEQNLPAAPAAAQKRSPRFSQQQYGDVAHAYPDPSTLRALEEEDLQVDVKQHASTVEQNCRRTCLKKTDKRRPPGTVPYEVGPQDSLNKISLKFNVTPNKLVHLNQLFSHIVVPGQVLFVPDSAQTEPKQHLLDNEDENTCRGKYTSLQKVLSPDCEDGKLVKFLKIDCRYFTDGMGVVGGVLIVTPNNIMFDPHKSDPLVVENGCEEYGLICPMEEVMSIALYTDISHMKLKDALPSDIPQDLCPLYRPAESGELTAELDCFQALDKDKQLIVLNDRFTGDQAQSSVLLARTFPRGIEPQAGGSTTCGSAIPNTLPCKENVFSENVDALTNVRKDNKLVREKNVAEEDVEISEQPRPIQDNKVSNSPKVVVETLKGGPAALGTWLTQSFQAPTEVQNKVPPMFLCFKVGKPVSQSYACKKSSLAHHYLKQDDQPEYWFAVPHERVDDLYAFFVQWSPDVYGRDAIDQGFIRVENNDLDIIDNFFSNPASKNWEIVKVNEARRRHSESSFENEEVLDLVPVLCDNSVLLTKIQIHKLARYLPARTQGYPWQLLYSTARHGTSLKTLYRNLAGVDSPVLLIIRDMGNQMFGAFSTHPFKISEHFYGTGETFLYSFCPGIKVFRWSGENSYFIKGNKDSLQLGGGGGHIGLWLDADLYHGTSSTCSTFKNEPLSSHEDFNIQELEVWSIQ